MKTRRWLIIGGIVILALAVAVPVAAAVYFDDLAQLRRATARYHRTEAAQAAGYDYVDGLDHCFFNPGVGGMGYHLINVDLLDTTLEALRPEAMVYRPLPNNKLQLAAVEYIVPAEAWDGEHPGQFPQVLGQNLHLNEALGVYVLHAWIWQKNPAGLFEDWNPQVTCSG